MYFVSHKNNFRISWWIFFTLSIVGNKREYFTIFSYILMTSSLGLHKLTINHAINH